MTHNMNQNYDTDTPYFYSGYALYLVACVCYVIWSVLTKYFVILISLMVIILVTSYCEKIQGPCSTSIVSQCPRIYLMIREL